MRTNKKLASKSKDRRFVFLVDGECEFWYIQMLKRNERAMHVTLKPELPQKKTLSEQYSKVIELSDDYDKVFWLIDLDVIIREANQAKKDKKNALQKFKEYHQEITKKYKEKIIIIINNPCLEYWYLLHFIETSKYFDSYEKLENDLKKKVANYNKTEEFHTKQNKDIYLRLKPFLHAAIKNANKLPAFDFDNPCSGMSQMQLFFETKEIAEVINF